MKIYLRQHCGIDPHGNVVHHQIYEIRIAGDDVKKIAIDTDDLLIGFVGFAPGDPICLHPTANHFSTLCNQSAIRVEVYRCLAEEMAKKQAEAKDRLEQVERDLSATEDPQQASLLQLAKLEAQAAVSQTQAQVDQETATQRPVSGVDQDVFNELMGEVTSTPADTGDAVIDTAADTQNL